MDSLATILTKRSTPAVLILHREGRLLYFNPEAQAFFPGIGAEPKQTRETNPQAIRAIPREITSLCARLTYPATSEKRNFALFRKGPGRLHSAMAHFIHPTGDQETSDHIVVIIQPVVSSHIDLNKARDQYHLSPREVEVLKLVCDGFSNRGIAEQLTISEYTARDHLKNLMRKMGVSSRSKIVALVI
jgi:DNA-binding CsgD family transcriptional regulator